MNEKLILRCEDTLDGIFTALYEAFEYRNRMKETPRSASDPGKTSPHKSAAAQQADFHVRSLAAERIFIFIGEGGEQELFAREITVRTDRSKAEKTIYAIQSKLGYMVYQTLVRALCHFDEERGTVVFHYLVQGFQKGRRVTEYLADPYVMRVMELSRKVDRECEKFFGFLRFRDVGKFLYAEIAPKCNVIPIMMEHFMDRYPNENFVIYDERRRYALIHPAYRECFFVKGELNKETPRSQSDPGRTSPHKSAAVLQAASKETPRLQSDPGRTSPHKSAAELQAAPKDEYEVLWKQYFQAMEIKERHNKKCQDNNLPEWYRKNMVEFSE